MTLTNAYPCLSPPARLLRISTAGSANRPSPASSTKSLLGSYQQPDRRTDRGQQAAADQADEQQMVDSGDEKIAGDRGGQVAGGAELSEVVRVPSQHRHRRQREYLHRGQPDQP